MKKKYCHNCGHMHKNSAGRGHGSPHNRSGKGNRGKTIGWQCMKRGCRCNGFMPVRGLNEYGKPI